MLMRPEIVIHTGDNDDAAEHDHRPVHVRWGRIHVTREETQDEAEPEEAEGEYIGGEAEAAEGPAAR